jgi:hypothetical protein
MASMAAASVVVGAIVLAWISVLGFLAVLVFF